MQACALKVSFHQRIFNHANACKLIQTKVTNIEFEIQCEAMCTGQCILGIEKQKQSKRQSKIKQHSNN